MPTGTDGADFLRNLPKFIDNSSNIMHSFLHVEII